MKHTYTRHVSLSIVHTLSRCCFTHLFLYLSLSLCVCLCLCLSLFSPWNHTIGCPTAARSNDSGNITSPQHTTPLTNSRYASLQLVYIHHANTHDTLSSRHSKSNNRQRMTYSKSSNRERMTYSKSNNRERMTYSKSNNRERMTFVSENE